MRYDDHVVLDRVSLTVRPGGKAGVVGDNGSDKSTLLRLLAGTRRPVIAPGGVGHLARTLGPPPTAPVGAAVDLALAELRALERRMRQAEADLGHTGPDGLSPYAALVAGFEARGGHDADRRVDTAPRRLGERTAPDRARPLGTLSGGQRSRLALAAALAAAPEVLLLDEPTDDLDDEALGRLEEHLLAHRGTVVAVTHDRVFLCSTSRRADEPPGAGPVEELEAALACCTGALVIVTHDRRIRGGFTGTRLEVAGGEVREAGVYA